jgi:hypothetical protein
MSVRSITAAAACAVAVALPAAAPAAQAAQSTGTGEQISWVRRAATRFVTAELTVNGGEGCAVQTAKRRGTVDGRTCEERFDTRARKLLRTRGMRSRLRAERRAIATATVLVDGNDATIELPQPLLDGSNHLLWTESCWMLTG